MAVTSSDAFKVQLAHVIVIELASSLSPSLPRDFRQVVAALAAAYAGPCGLSSSCDRRDLRLFVCLPPPSPSVFFCARFKGNLGAVNKFWHLIIFCGFVRHIYLCVPQWQRQRRRRRLCVSSIFGCFFQGVAGFRRKCTAVAVAVAAPSQV